MKSYRWFLLVLYSLMLPYGLFATTVSDSLDYWLKHSDFKAICAAADALLESPKKRIPACDRLRLLSEASSAATDLFEPAHALAYAEAALQQAASCHDSALIVQAIMHQAIANNLLGNMDVAVKLTERVIAYAVRTQDERLLIPAYTNLGMMLNKIGEFKQAKTQFEHALELIKKTPDHQRLAITYVNISLCYLNLKDAKQGLTWVDSALVHARLSEVPPVIAHCYALKSSMYFQLGDSKKWLVTLDSAIAISVKSGNLNQAAHGVMDKFQFHIRQKDYPTALKEGEQAMRLLANGDQKPLLRNAYLYYYELYKGMGKPAESLRYLEKYTALKDSLDNVDFKNQVHEANLKYEVAEKDKAILQSTIDLKNSNLRSAYALTALVVVAGIAFFFYWKIKTHRQSILELFEKERALERENAFLRQLLPKEEDAKSEPTASESLSETSTSLFIHAQQLMVREKPYLNPEFNRNDLAQLLGTNRHYLSEALNEVDDGGFRSFINQFRIAEAKELIWGIAKNSSAIPLSGIWQYAGFNSNQSFYRVFKAMTQLTPKQYLELVTRELKGSDS